MTTINNYEIKPFANLEGAKLEGANLQWAKLQGIKGDFFARMTLMPQEVPALRQAIIDGKINGSSYSDGDCACFVGTMERVSGLPKGACPIPREPNSATERWFLAIRRGDTPDSNEVSAITLNWVDEFIAALAK